MTTSRQETERTTQSAGAELLAAKARDDLHAEFGAVHPAETIERVFDESVKVFGEADIPDYVARLARRHARDRLRALGQVEGRIARDRPEIVFVGLEGRGRSQMAAALAELRSEGRVHAVAAGTSTTTSLDPTVIAAMAEVGCDPTEPYPKPLSDEVLHAADVVVTLGRSVGEVDVPGDR
jgi:arsenate reductase